MRAAVSFGLGILAILAVAACSTKQELPAPVPQAEATPREITDLSSLGPDRAQPAAALGGDLRAGFAQPGAEPSPGGASLDSQNNLRRLFLSNPGQGKFAGSASAPGELRLTNAKAAKFGGFSNKLLDQLFVATQELEARKLSSTVLSENLAAVVISATMDGNGQLRELTIEEHSGSGAVDQLMVEACKKALWVVNPPREALDADGTYHLKVDAKLKNFNRTTQANRWNFDTRLGLGLE